MGVTFQPRAAVFSSGKSLSGHSLGSRGVCQVLGPKKAAPGRVLLNERASGLVLLLRCIIFTIVE
jgi:hypothetical protein